MRWVLVGALLAVPSVAPAGGPVVSVGAMGGSRETRALLRRLLIHELGTAFGAPAGTSGPRFELQGAITRLERLGDPRSTRAALSCEVSLLVLEQPGGALRAILSGSSRLNVARRPTVESGADEADVEAAVRIAVRGAVRRFRTARLGEGRGGVLRVGRDPEARERHHADHSRGGGSP
jgi:hypothetical protein